MWFKGANGGGEMRLRTTCPFIMEVDRTTFPFIMEVDRTTFPFIMEVDRVQSGLDACSVLVTCIDLVYSLD